MHMIGDSLAVGTKPFLNDAWRSAQHASGRKGSASSNALGGRTLAQGMHEYNAMKHKPKVMAMGLFTNDDPGDVAKLRAAVKKTIADARKRGGRVVWATIARPPYGGTSYDAANRMLRELAEQNQDVMGLADWAREVHKRPSLLDQDHIHATSSGYKVRARLYAQAAAGPR